MHGHGELHEVVIPIGDKQQQRKRTCLIRAVRMRLGYTTRGSDTKEYKNCLIDRRHKVWGFKTMFGTKGG